MPFLLRNIELNPGEGEELLAARIMDRFSLAQGELTGIIFRRKGIDARKKQQIKFIYTIEFTLSDEAGFWRKHHLDRDLEIAPLRETPLFRKVTGDKRIVIVGTGPAGLFAALRLAEYGLAPIVLERGKRVEERVKDIASFWRKGSLNPESNVQFGEGGAGTFSDGKLTTRVRDENSAYVLGKLVEFGAPGEILHLAKPHVGTDRLRRVIVNIRRHLESRGVVIRFREKVTDIISRGGRLQGVVINDRSEELCDFLLLAPGNSARDTYSMLERRGVMVERKPFAVGVRVEHPQELINRIQFGVPRHPHLPPADYALTWNNGRTGRSAYSFCMCPGGVVVAASSEEGGVATNGMSDYLRNSPCANSALVVSVGKEDFPGDSPLAGIEFQRSLERAAYVAGGSDYRAPAQNLMAFMGERGRHRVVSTYRPGVVEADLSILLPGFVTETLREGIRSFERKMRGFITAEATLTGVETRTSAPVRILRGDDLQSPTMQGLYPVGEGAGYAGGIMSSALDGIRAADAVAGSLA
jgi:uncharacterized FAD-dependent dehydrogenase